MAVKVPTSVFFNFLRHNLTFLAKIVVEETRSVAEADNTKKVEEIPTADETESESEEISDKSLETSEVESAEDYGVDEDSETDSHVRLPQKRGKYGKKKKFHSNFESSDEEILASDSELEKEGNPLEMEPEEEISPEDLKDYDFQWTNCGKNTSFPWNTSLSHPPDSGIKRISTAEFKKKSPFEILQLFVPISWFEEITAETNR